MASILAFLIAFAFLLPYSSLTRAAPVAQCRSIPGDTAWPSSADWATLNNTVDGRLIATIPLAAPCHKALFNLPNLAFDLARCEALRTVWYYPETHLQSASSPMAYPFSNNSCNPWLGPDTPCTLGFHPVFSINATKSAHYRAAILFATKHNIRLVIRNTGHDYLGKSTGAHALEIWTHSVKGIKLFTQYTGPTFSGPAIKIGAGVLAGDAYTFASEHGLVIVGGNCPTVALAGGYTQGAGHGPFASRFGLAADQVLEWEVVTATGELLTANAQNNSDLYWALRGGGGGTFGVVVAMTVKAFPDTFTSTATMTVLKNETNADALYEGIGTFLQNLLSLVNSGATAVWVAAPFGFMLTPAMAPGIHQSELDEILKPTLDKFHQLGLETSYSSREHTTFLTAYNSLTESWNVSNYNVGGRLIPRELVANNTAAITRVIRNISERTLMSGVSYNVSHSVASPDDVAVNPYFRKTLFSLTVGTPINYTDWSATTAAQNEITHDFLPQVEKLTPNGGAYLNEGDFQAPDFRTLFYGAHYDKLLKIKDKYDPQGIFYAKTAVGSDRWEQDANGRLCRTKG
ncbi:FAD-binding domain-containing protein [Lindgomyces ingoldianus]|uniref:FAD-binding domain-containing protein n=1 Tax=Lindgomyces ingoldianus TaxID=673940 RepID=A0ACB6QN49_9PLEO|nr:FAD-binding domain-containing protein [Lindgomyces ingoldianus]KAF2468315.1 FAD-binding domain-containing protein [Lindgomyces ingoldianus]